ncbi:MAG: hypothetical protein ACRDWI_02165 [Jiangellaceae bacterium]
MPVSAVRASPERVAAGQGELGLLPVLPALRGLLPGLRRGQVVSIEGGGSLALAFAAGASAEGSWCAVVGMPDCGVLAAAGMGVDLARLLLIDEPGPRWAEVVATLVGSVEVVLLRPPVRPSSVEVRRLTAHARRHGGVLVVAGGWTGAPLRLRVVSSIWTGLGDGHGNLRGRRVRVVAEGKGRPETAWLWLPGPDGSVEAADVAVDELVEAAG